MDLLNFSFKLKKKKNYFFFQIEEMKCEFFNSEKNLWCEGDLLSDVATKEKKKLCKTKAEGWKGGER